MAAERGNPVAWNNLGSLYASKVPELKSSMGRGPSANFLLIPLAQRI
jgi:hypothetical protein